ncbi:MAG: hypothetical protein ABIP75_19495, partial [Pyrinomonadaceae bacterium]
MKIMLSIRSNTGRNSRSERWYATALPRINRPVVLEPSDGYGQALKTASIVLPLRFHYGNSTDPFEPCKAARSYCMLHFQRPLLCTVAVQNITALN